MLKMHQFAHGVLFNGDCQEVMTDIGHIEKAVIVSDPPFNQNYHYSTYKDNKPEDEYYEWLSDIFSPYPSVIIHYPESLYKLAFQMGKFPERVVSWVYNSNTAKQHRDIAFFDVKPDFNKVRQPYKNPNDKRIKARIEAGKTGAKLYDWWNINQVKNVSKKDSTHPCQMPLEVMKNIVGLLPEDAVIIDPFMGSGTTAVACEALNRKWIGIEMDEGYFTESIQRIEVFVKGKENECKD